uniref:Uncharacterized protein n=1 Tax=Aegilops tauschii subsp. strangulata TaxID=200361 RepID=A0A452YXY1_AEGTS
MYDIASLNISIVSLDLFSILCPVCYCPIKIIFCSLQSDMPTPSLVTMSSYQWKGNLFLIL